MRELRPVVRRRVRLCAIVAFATLLGACGGSDNGGESEASRSSRSTSATNPEVEAAPLPRPVQQLEINASEYTFKISPDPSGGLKAGWTLLKFHNVGVEPHQVMFARLKDGVDMSKLAAAGANDSSGAAAIEFVDMIGGVSYIGPGQDTTAMVKLPAGTVMAMCYVPDANGVAHALMGMTTVLSVSAPADVAESTALGVEKVHGTIELSNDGYQIPNDLGAGWYHVKNSDSALHELSLLRLGRSVTKDQTASLVKDLAGNTTPKMKVEAVGGMGALSAGFDGYLHLDLADGHYLAVDFMPDPGVPRPHMVDGYYSRFSI